MPKINRGYVSLFEALASAKHHLPFIARLNEYFYPDEAQRMSDAAQMSQVVHPRWNPNPFPGEQFVGSFQPIADMLKDVIDTFKPYKSRYHAKRDFLQPIRGLGNIARGIWHLIFAPIAFVILNLINIAKSSSVDTFLERLFRSIYYLISYLLDGSLSIVRGILQIVTAPLTWLLRMPVRGIRTLIEGSPQIEQNPGLQRVVAIAETTLETISSKSAADQTNRSDNYNSIEILSGALHELHRKYHKAAERGQSSKIALTNAGNLFPKENFAYFDKLSEKQIQTARAYIELFK